MTKTPSQDVPPFDIQKAIHSAVRFHRQGALEDAEQLYEAVLETDPSNFNALHLLGVLRGQRGRPEAAVELISLALEQRPDSAEAHSNLGFALATLNRFDEAIASYDKALAIEPNRVEALTHRANALLSVNRVHEGIASYEKALVLRPDRSVALNNYAVALTRLKRYDEALANFDKALAAQPDYVDAHYNRARALFDLHRFEEAVRSFDDTLRFKPDHVDALINRGNALQQLKHYDEAIASYGKALAIEPNRVEALTHRANALVTVNQVDEAVANYEKALALKPDRLDALKNHAVALARLKRYDEALSSLDRALAVQPDYVEAHYSRARALFDLHRIEEAVRSFDDTLRFKPDHVDALIERGNALDRMKRYKEAIASYDKALAINPEYRGAAGRAAHARGSVCDWTNRNCTVQQLVDGMRAGKPVIPPFVLLSLSDSPEDQLTCATFFCSLNPVIVRSSSETSQSPPRKRIRRHQDRIRLAYLSADFHDHATAFLMAGLFERHDRSRFEITAISFGPDLQSSMRSRLVSSFERFIDVRTNRDEDVAALLRDSGCDIAVDLKGFTKDARTGILAHRPAPIQVNYLGYPGTMGADFIDYIVADEFVIPWGDQKYYAEKVVYLPECYQVNDSKRKISDLTPTRGEVGLPERGFVFCCFNKPHKITSQVFDVWMRLLAQVDHSVLWLYTTNATAIENLRREAAARRIDPTRLVFARACKLEHHLARHRLADLFLDTLPYNAHTTASDALWAGLPVLTCAGRTFAGRVAGSLLHAVGLPDLVVHTLEDYEALALKLAREEGFLREVKEKLARNRLIKPLFDTDRFRRHIEAAYVTMWETHQRGEAPRSFAVPPVD